MTVPRPRQAVLAQKMTSCESFLKQTNERRISQHKKRNKPAVAALSYKLIAWGMVGDERLELPTSSV